MNELAQLQQKTGMSIEQIGDAIKKATGRTYNLEYLRNVARGYVRLSDSLRLNLFLTFDDFVLPRPTQNSENTHSLIEAK